LSKRHVVNHLVSSERWPKAKAAAPQELAVQSQQPPKITRAKDPMKYKPYKVNATDSKAESSWLGRYKQLVKYKQEFGSCDMLPKTTNQILNWDVGYRSSASA
jgi:hypothetical protein